MPLSARRTTALAMVVLLIPTAALGCAWDYDTIKMERTRFPGTLELITGKFLRHSPEFYRWRIDNRVKRLESDPDNAALLDDLAVAYDKTDQHDKAIETALRTEKAHPGRYETSSNLSTFYFHSGRFEEARAPIDRALAINPEAHFGREKYQKLLLEYVIKRSTGGKLNFPLAEMKVESEPRRESPTLHRVSVSEPFDEFVVSKYAPALELAQQQQAIKAVLGMMKFAKFDSPVLLEALGALLIQRRFNPTDDARLLGARAFLKASYEFPEGTMRTSYRELAGYALEMQTPRRDEMGQITVEKVEVDFQKELAEGQAWYADLREKELAWIRDGKDPEAEFDKLYEIEPEVAGMDVKDPMSNPEKIEIAIVVAGVLLVLFAVAALVGTFLLIRQYGRWRTRSASAARAKFETTSPTGHSDADSRLGAGAGRAVPPLPAKLDD